MEDRLSSLDTKEVSGDSTNLDDVTWEGKSESYGSDIAKDANLKVHEINGSSPSKTLGNKLNSTLTKEQLKRWCDWAKDQNYQYETFFLFKR